MKKTLRYNVCPLCKKRLKRFPNNQRGCRDSVCNSDFTDWGENDYYFIRSYEKGEMPLPTDLIIETLPNKGLTRILRGFDRNHIFNIDRIYNLANPQELNRLFKIVDKIYNNLYLQ